MGNIIENQICSDVENLFKETNIEWKKGLQVEYERLVDSGMAHNGHTYKILMKRGEELLNILVDNITEIINKYEKYKRKISQKSLISKIDRWILSINNMIDNFSNDVELKIQDKILMDNESNKRYISCLKDNYTNKLNRIYSNVVNIRSIDRVKIITIINLVVTFFGSIASIWSLVMQINGA